MFFHTYIYIFILLVIHSFLNKISEIIFCLCFTFYFLFVYIFYFVFYPFCFILKIYSVKNTNISINIKQWCEHDTIFKHFVLFPAATLNVNSLKWIFEVIFLHIFYYLVFIYLFCFVFSPFCFIWKTYSINNNNLSMNIYKPWYKHITTFKHFLLFPASSLVINYY